MDQAYHLSHTLLEMGFSHEPQLRLGGWRMKNLNCSLNRFTVLSSLRRILAHFFPHAHKINQSMTKLYIVLTDLFKVLICSSDITNKGTLTIEEVLTSTLDEISTSASSSASPSRCPPGGDSRAGDCCRRLSP